MGCNTSSIKSVIDPSKLDQLEKTVDQTANVVKDTITEAKSQLENISNMDLVKGASLITNALTSDGKSRPEGLFCFLFHSFFLPSTSIDGSCNNIQTQPSRYLT